MQIGGYGMQLDEYGMQLDEYGVKVATFGPWLIARDWKFKLSALG